jgi:hypothetical protein
MGLLPLTGAVLPDAVSAAVPARAQSAAFEEAMEQAVTQARRQSDGDRSGTETGKPGDALPLESGCRPLISEPPSLGLRRIRAGLTCAANPPSSQPNLPEPQVRGAETPQIMTVDEGCHAISDEEHLPSETTPGSPETAVVLTPVVVPVLLPPPLPREPVAVTAMSPLPPQEAGGVGPAPPISPGDARPAEGMASDLHRAPVAGWEVQPPSATDPSLSTLPQLHRDSLANESAPSPASAMERGAEPVAREMTEFTSPQTANTISAPADVPAPPSGASVAAIAPATFPASVNMPIASEESRELSATPPAPLSGTSTAKSSSWLRNSEQMAKARRNPDPSLPEAATLSADPAENARPRVLAEASAAPSREGTKEKLPSEVGSDAPSVGPTSFRTVTRSTSAPELAPPAAALSLEQIESRMTNVVAELKRLKPDTMSVMLRPDGRTELHLHLQVTEGRVQIEARVQRGDPATLAAQWGQLQQSLSAQGIRLSSLQPMPTPMPSMPDWTGGASQQQQHREHQEAPVPKFEAPADPAGAPSAATVADKVKPRRSPTTRSWESWA